MGLFSFLSKNKQGRTAEDSGRFYSKDDDAAIGERARAKRASNAGASAGAAGRRSANDPMLPEKKRARRRLVGAVALALAAAVGLPMLLDSAPKPLAGDIAIQIPSKDKAAPLPVPGAAEPGAAADAAPSDAAPAAARDKAVAAADSVDKGEEIIDAPPAPVRKPEVKEEAVKAKPDAKPAAKPEHKDIKAEARLAEARLAERERADRERADRADRERERADKAERERADRAARLEKQRADDKAKKLEDKPVKPAPAHSDTRALAILEGKGADKTADKAADKDKPSDAGGPKVTLQVAAMSSQEKAADLQARLRGAGISSHTEKFGELIRVKVGPLSKDDAERVRAKLNKMGL